KASNDISNLLHRRWRARCSGKSDPPKIVAALAWKRHEKRLSCAATFYNERGGPACKGCRNGRFLQARGVPSLKSRICTRIGDNGVETDEPILIEDRPESRSAVAPGELAQQPGISFCGCTRRSE